MATQWYYRINGDNVGPVSSKVLKQLAATGTVTQDTPIRKEGRDKWVAARHVKGLLPESSVPATQAPPAPQQGEQAPPPAQKPSDTEQWLWLTESGEQPPKPLSCLHKMFLEGQLKPTDCLQPYDTLREEGVTNPIPAGDLFDKDSAVIPDGWKSWTVVSGGATHAPCSIERIERLYNNGDMSDEDTVTRTGCRTLTLAQLFDPDEVAQGDSTLPLSEQPDSVQAITTGIVGLLIGLVFGVSYGGILMKCFQGFCIGVGFDYVASKSRFGKRLATAPGPVVCALVLSVWLVGPMLGQGTTGIETVEYRLGFDEGEAYRVRIRNTNRMQGNPTDLMLSPSDIEEVLAHMDAAGVRSSEQWKKGFRKGVASGRK